MCIYQYSKEVINFISEMNENEISKWKEDETIFLETHNFPAMLEQVRKQSFVTAREKQSLPATLH